MKKYFVLYSCLILSVIAYVSCEKNFDTLDITASTPANHSMGVISGFYAEIEFNNNVNKADVEDNFSIKGSSGIPGTFSWISGKKFRFIPSNPVTKTGRYIIELPRSVRDCDGNIMDTDFISDFYIGTDFIPPSVLSSDPPFTTGAAENIAVDSSITVQFSKNMNRESVEKAFTVTPDVGGYFIWSANDSALTYTLLTDMAYGKLYSFTVSKNCNDTSGNSLSSDYRVFFRTGNDFTLPHVLGIYDSSIAPGYWSTESVNDAISRDVKITVRFSEAMDRITVESSFSITPSVQGNYEWLSDNDLVFVPSSPLDPETNYQIYIDKTAKDVHGLSLSSVYSIEVKTGAINSRYVKCGNISGSPDGVDFTPLSTGVPDPDTWPLIITMGPLVPADQSQNYYIKIQFVSSFDPYTAVDVDKYSVINNKLIETFRSGPGGISVSKAEIVNISWEDNDTVILKFNPMTNKLLSHSPALYRLTLAGGANGLKDIDGNYAERDIVIEFREAL